MRIVRDLADLPPTARGSALAIGNFDGLHPGHRAVLDAMLAAPEGVPKAVLTFVPHPRRFFRPDEAGEALEPFHLRARRLAALGIEWLFCQRFDAAFSSLTADAFVDEVLIGALGVTRLTTGEDFAFGKGRGGDVAMLYQRAEAAGIAYRAVPPVIDGDGLHSSSRIRAALKEGDPVAAARLLGRPYEMSGRIVHGDARGRTLGRPTMNLLPTPGAVLPRFGVYAVRFAFGGDRTGEREDWADGVANFGVRPTFDGESPRLEIHGFEPLGERYGERVRVQLAAFLRPERRFESPDALMTQIGLDAEAAKALFSTTPSGETA